MLNHLLSWGIDARRRKTARALSSYYRLFYT